MEQRRLTVNNIPVYSYCQNHLHSFCLGLFVKAGVLYEQPGEGGITHFLEHVLFRNMDGMTQRELYEKLESIGAYFNAVTYKEFMQFYIIGTPRHFDACAEIITRLLAPLSVTASDVAVERRRIQSEIREEDVFHSFEYLALKETWQDTPLADPIMGSIKGLNKIGLPGLKAAKDRFFQAGNLCFYVTGCCTEDNIDHLCRQAERYALPQGGPARQNVAPLPPDFQKRGGRLHIRHAKELPDLHFSFDVPCVRYSMAEMHLLYDILFKGTLSRFQMELSENTGLIYSFDSVMDRYSNAGVFYAQYSVTASRLYEAVERTIGIFRSMKTAIDQADLAHHLPRYSDNYDLMLDEPESLNWDMAYDNFVLGRGYRSIDEIKALFLAVTPERLMEIANEIFQPDNLVVVIRAPRGKCKEERVRGILATL